ncbi:aminopeptidase [uncultured Draconibacterium sp.]|uniref:aminopeptidase n=1 Tax=uncultured Draconibacterium sp. TaxID=1573823 RepID=UPI0032170E46
MKKLIFTFVFLLCLSVAFGQNNGKEDLEKLASTLVNQCAGIEENEIVLINGSVRDLELLENLAVNVRKKGAFPLLTIDSERMTKRMFFDVPEKYDTQLSLLNKGLINMMTAQISVSSAETPGLLADVPPERFATRNKAGKPNADLYRQKQIKAISLGNGLYPTKALAEEFGITLDKLTELFWSGVNIDYNLLNETGKKLEAKLVGANELKITHTNGTNFTVKITNCKPIISDGVISEEDFKSGFVGRNVYLPAGEVYFAPVENTANGKLVFDHQTFMGETIKNLELDFKDGKLVSMKADSGLDKLKEYYDAQDELIGKFSLIDFGINPNVKIPKGSKFLSYIPAGSVTVGLGNNLWAGGVNNSISGLNFFMPVSTVTLDGKIIIDKGNLK